MTLSNISSRQALDEKYHPSLLWVKIPNNYVHLVSLVKASPDFIDHVVSSPKPGTKLLPQSTKKIVVRLSNTDAMLNNAVRVENEVAAITLMQDALSRFPYRIVPNVYDWNTAAEGQGWIVQEYMHGELLGDRFSNLSESQKQYILDQVAQVFKMIQCYTPGVTGFGGLKFDDEGKVVTTGLTIWFGGPFTAYTDMYLYIFQKQIELSKSTPLVDGWKGTGLDERLKAFDESGQFSKLLYEYSNIQPTLVHGDLSLENILFNPDTLQVTALLDFDFAHIASPGDEFFYSFADFHGIIPGPLEDREMNALRLAQLNGFKDNNVKNLTRAVQVDWKTAKMWQVAMEKSQVRSPADIENVGELATIYWFLLDICPPYFLLPCWLKRRTEEQKQASKRDTQANLDKYLKRWGY
ncbi:kinase-like domain-containing protein [Xylogone sp. PMI_703]|nr:kinase-like domain-containing protein [Xylogone sp. PMI_703]